MKSNRYEKILCLTILRLDYRDVTNNERLEPLHVRSWLPYAWAYPAGSRGGADAPPPLDAQKLKNETLKHNEIVIFNELHQICVVLVQLGVL